MNGPTCIFKQRTNLVLLFSSGWDSHLFLLPCHFFWELTTTRHLKLKHTWKQKENCLKSFFAICKKEHDGRMKNFIYWMFYVCTQFFFFFRLLPLLNFSSTNGRDSFPFLLFFSFYVRRYCCCRLLGDEMWGFAVVYLPSRFPRETWRIGKRFNAIWWDYVS